MTKKALELTKVIGFSSLCPKYHLNNFDNIIKKSL